MGEHDVPTVDFGRTAKDYARHRPGFPPEFFEAVGRQGFGTPRQRVLDVGTGTGTLARGFAERGALVVGLDPSETMLAEAAALARADHLNVRWLRATAEETGLPDRSFDMVCAGQCWHWFDRARAGAECRRLLESGGCVLVAYFSYLPEPGTVGEATEELVLRHNPTWPMAGSDGRYPRWAEGLREAGFIDVETFELDVPVSFTHEGWRGRFRACNGVLALPPEQLAAFDQELQVLLDARFPEPLVSRHRIFWIVGTKP